MLKIKHMLPRHSLLAVRDRLAKSRVFTISLTFHIFLIVVFGGKVVIDQVREPEEIPPAIIAQEPAPPPRPMENREKPSMEFPVTLPPTTLEADIRHLVTDVLDLQPQVITPPSQVDLLPVRPSQTRIVDPSVGGLTNADLSRIKVFSDWAVGDSSKPLAQRSFAFTAFIGKTSQGNWNSTIRQRNNKITGGSLPNLLYAMDKWSKGKIDTNERNVQAIGLDSDELLTLRPPFIFLTGTQDFKLTEKEVENLRTYIRCGGAVWGDSSVPGQRSAFDHAFRREMKIVLGGDAAKFEALPKNHSIYTAGYFPNIREEPAGLNNYREPLEVLRWNGEIAVLHTRNDYGDMWQVGLDAKGQIDLSRNEQGEYIAMDPALWAHRGVYVRNIEQPAVENAYRFGINVVIHLVTRWESKVSSSPTL